MLPLFLQTWGTSCFANSADRNQPIHLEADQVIMDDARQVSTFIGNVQMTQGSLLIRGDKIIVTQDKDGFQNAIAYGDTAEFRQKREHMDGYVEGYGEQIEYDTRTGILNLYGKARLKRDLDEVSGNHIVYNAKTEIFKVNSNDANSDHEPSQRVRAVLQPKSNMTAQPASGVSPSKPASIPAKQNE
ncbi:MAG: lipopolysaccharide transport periplasmic protein LptA [Gallionella sp.]